MKQGTTRRGKPHCEAFPAIDILAAERSLRSGSERCEWRDEQGAVVGKGSLVALDGTRMTLDYTFIGSANIAAARDVLTVMVSGTRRNPHVVRKSFHCLSCQSRVQVLYFVTGAWSCRRCHNLVYLKQRLGAVNKNIVYRDEIAADLGQVEGRNRATRDFHNQQRHLDRINRELAQFGFTALPEELCYRTTCRWLDAGEVSRLVDGQAATACALSSRLPGLAYFRPPDDEASDVPPCELIGSPILNRPMAAFLEQHVGDTLAAVERDIAKGAPLLPRQTAAALSAVVAERLILQPLRLTSGWSDIDDRYTWDDRAESTSSARYVGDRRLWKIGVDSAAARQPLCAILDDHCVQVCVRLPEVGRSDARRDIKAAASEIETRLADVHAMVNAFNAERSEIALRAVRQRRRQRQASTG